MRENSNQKKKGRLKKIILFILFQILFIPSLAIVLIFYGPFNRTRDMIVTTAMGTMSHQYFATWFLDDEEIYKILEANRPKEDLEEQSLEEVDTSKVEDDDEIELIDVSTNSFKGYLLIVHDPSRVELATAPKLGKVGSTLSQIIAEYDAVGGINAGGFADDAIGTGGKPTGIIIEDGEIKHIDSYYINYSAVGIDENNKLIISNSISYYTLKSKKIRDAVSFGPVIIINGNPTITSGNGGMGIHPRTAIAQTKDGKILMLVIDGRQTSSIGATIRNVQDILLKYGAYNAFNLDGGASTTMYYNDKLINNPSDILGERYIPSAFIITKKTVDNSDK